MTKNYAAFLYLNTFLLTCCIYRTFLKMREHLAPLQSLSITLMFITGRVELEQTPFEVKRQPF